MNSSAPFPISPSDSSICFSLRVPDCWCGEGHKVQELLARLQDSGSGQSTLVEGPLLFLGCLVKQLAQGRQDGRALQLQMVHHLCMGTGSPDGQFRAARADV